MNLNQLPVVIRRDVPTAQLPAVYETAKKALAACVALDECKEWSDKAAALASYARQAKNTILEDHAKRIRIRALERAGQLLLEIRPTYGRKAHPNSRKATAANAGMTACESTTAIRLAGNPKAVRDALIDGPNPPSNPVELRRKLPPIRKPTNPFIASAIYRKVIQEGNALTAFVNHVVRKHSPKVGRQFTAEEASRIRPVLIEVGEWVDEFERNLPRAKK